MIRAWGNPCSWGVAAASLVAASALLTFGAARAASDIPLPKPAPKCDRGNFRVVLDVGHSADAPGAISARGKSEYGFNLRLAKRIDDSLVDAGFDKTVLMVTGGNARRTLYLRMAHANRLSADLFLSIHHDSVPDKFYKKWEFNGAPHIYNDQFKGYSIFVSDRNVDRDASLEFGSILGNELHARGLQYTPHYTAPFMGHNRHKLLDDKAGVYRYDALFVLSRSHVPAVLLEAGSIVNRHEELALASPARQKLIGAAVVDAVDTFCLAQVRSGPQVTQSAKRVQHPRRSRHPRKREAEAAPTRLRYRPGAAAQ
ncbi:MAG: N-acetylmuramoyl-L-alanine amidase [Pseudolabrys sp.]